jgi:serine/threonine-protein kinase
MKLVKGRTLAALLKERTSPTVDLPRFLSIFEAVCQTMAYSHARGVIHRDLKPSNIMVGGFGEVQVMDWGLAKVLARNGVPGVTGTAPSSNTVINIGRSADSPEVSLAGQVMGTPAYMAPEQARGESECLDERVDVFALGAILCEILTGRPPWSGTTTGEILQQAACGTITDIFVRLDVCGADVELIAVAKYCMNAERANRPRDAGEVSGRLSTYLARVQERLRTAERAQIEAQARAEESAKRAAVERSRRRLTTALAGSALLIISLVGIGTFVYQRQVREESARLAIAFGQALQRRAAAREAWSNRRDATGWDRALEAAEELTKTRLPSDLRGRAILLRNEIRTEAHVARSDRDLLDRLTSVRALKGNPESDASYEYARAFRDLGVVIDDAKFEPSSVAAQLRLARPKPVLVQLASFVDDWSLLIRGTEKRGPAADRLLLLASSLDPDTWRNELRIALANTGLDQRRAVLVRLSAATDLMEQPVATLTLLATGLRGVNEFEKAITLLERARFRYRGDAWMHQELGLALRLSRPPRIEDALRAFTAAATIQPEMGYELAMSLSATGRTREGIAVMEDVLYRQPDAACYFWLGLMKVGLGRKDAAASFAKSAGLARGRCELHPDDARVHFLLGDALHEMGDHKGAVAAYREALRLEPGSVNGQVNLGNALRDSDDLKAAEAAYRAALRIQPDNARAHSMLGLALRATGDLAGAVAECREAVRLVPAQAGSHFALGIALWGAGDRAAAIAAYREAVRLQSDSFQFRVQLARALHDSGDAAGAAVVWREAIRIAPDSADVHSELGRALQSTGDTQGAIAESREAVRLQPDSLGFRTSLAQALGNSGDAAGAAVVWREVIRMAPDFAYAHSSLGMALKSMGDMQGAIAECRRAVRLQPDSADAHGLLGIVMVAAFDPAGAIAEYREAIRLNPDLADAHALLGSALRRIGDQDGAVAACREAVRLRPDFPIAHCDLGLALQLKGEYREALAELRRGHELGSRQPSWAHPSDKWVREGERRMSLAARLPAVLRGDTLPSDVTEMLEFARIASECRKYSAAVQLFAKALEAEPQQAADPAGQPRYEAACSAVLASIGQGEDEPKLEAMACDQLRRRALNWLREERASWARAQSGSSPTKRTKPVFGLGQWKNDPRLAAVRDAKALSKLPEDEQSAWRALWVEVEDLLSGATVQPR